MQPTLEINIEDWVWDAMVGPPTSPMEEDLEDEGLPPMHHHEIDDDWEPPLTVIPDSQPEEGDWPEPLTGGSRVLRMRMTNR
jgi:hypothetical protein